jgi:transposase
VVLVGRPGMAWLRIALTEEEQRVVHEERESHPEPHVRRRMLVLWSLHCGLKREQAAKLAGVARSTVERYGLAGLRRCVGQGPVSDLAAYRDVIRDSFERQPVGTIAEACVRIEPLTGLRRGLSQVRQFLKDLGLKWQRLRAIPVPPQKTWQTMSPSKPCFTTRH